MFVITVKLKLNLLTFRELSVLRSCARWTRPLIRTFSEQLHANNDLNDCNANKNNKLIVFTNGFTKSKTNLMRKIESEVIFDNYVRMYSCGPTVYDDCHLGHALTYIRLDLLVRVLRYYCNVNVLLAMGVTDIDDKIIAKANQTNTNYKTLANHYYTSFMEDMQSLKITSADCYLRVSDHIPHIIAYVKRIHQKDLAYISSTGDINFDSIKFSNTFGITHSFMANEMITDKSVGKRSPHDFALWKAAKPGEPHWDYVTPDGQTITGRPGLY